MYECSGETRQSNSDEYFACSGELGAQAFWGDVSTCVGVFLVVADLFPRRGGSSWVSLLFNVKGNWEKSMAKKIRLWSIAFTVVLLYFYGLDHFIMNIQGLPLTVDLKPSQ
ncbi:MAG: hypothetical protein GXP08_15925 [Gammaproteobacteria bacterium]|nr:hypothetical protein [Gammaproteobacteria bacterium]